MTSKTGKPYPPISANVPRLLHGADYNPDQWQKYPEILREDIRLMKLANCNVMSVGIFAWSAIEPEEGVYAFEWLDQVLDSLAAHDIYVFLATPSGARPPWMSAKYPEVLRVDANRVRILHGKRHNHCYTSPVYREKVHAINAALAGRYAFHPAVIGWHVSNEYGGECHCRLCQEAFRAWLKRKYKTLDNLNHAWWAPFWGHILTSWEQVESPAPHGQSWVHGLQLDWKRFVTDQTVDFLRHEIDPLRAVRPDLPVTTNLMGTYDGLNYAKFAEWLDIISWDAYPFWHEQSDDRDEGVRISFIHDLNRSLKNGKPFMLMESTPSTTNWMPVCKLKRPGMHLLSSLQAVAHGADTVQYFQWRKGRGASEKFHGAVVDHAGSANTRVFRDVAEVGESLIKLGEVAGTTVYPQAAVIFDWENRWAIEQAQGPRNAGMHYEETVVRFYAPFWERGIPVDVISMDADFSKYKLLIAPMLYMVRPGVGERIARFVENGGTFVATYWSGIVDENDLCHLGGFPGPLRKTLGIWSEEIDSLHEGESRRIRVLEDDPLGLHGTYEARELCDLIHLEGAKALALYEDDFYAGRPALTVHRFGEGKAYYVASRNGEPFLSDFLGAVIRDMGLTRVVEACLPRGVTAQMRTDGESDYVFLMNFGGVSQTVELDDCHYRDMLEQVEVGESSRLMLPPYGIRVLERQTRSIRR